MNWNPSDEEIFVFRRDDSKLRRVVLLIPNPEETPSEIIIDGYSYEYDEEMTDQTRMHVRVSNRKRGLAD